MITNVGPNLLSMDEDMQWHDGTEVQEYLHSFTCNCKTAHSMRQQARCGMKASRCALLRPSVPVLTSTKSGDGALLRFMACKICNVVSCVGRTVGKVSPHSYTQRPSTCLVLACNRYYDMLLFPAPTFTAHFVTPETGHMAPTRLRF